MNTAIIRAFGALNAWIYRWTDGRIGGRFAHGAPVLLLTTKGRRSGRVRTAPLLYLQDGGGYVVVGSQSGAPSHPGWYFNLMADPHAEVQIGRQRSKMLADELGDAERERLWPKFVALYPPYETYRQRTSRRIPLIRLTPAGE